MPRGHLRLVYPHQLFDDHLGAPRGTRFLLVEDDLLLRQYAFHAHKLVLHRASAQRFVGRLRDAGFDVDVVESRAQEPTGPRLAAYVAAARPDRVSVYDVVDDWLSSGLTAALLDGGYRLRGDDVLESPGFLTTRREFTDWFENHPARMHYFYAWQRNRLDVLVDDGRPVGGRWSFDKENRKRLPKSHVPPPVDFPASQPPEVRAAIDWVAEQFPNAPGNPAAFAWPTGHVEARRHLGAFVRDRLSTFGPYEDAISVQHRYLYHAVLTPMLNTGLLTPREVLDAALAEGLRSGDAGGVPLASLEGFVRQVIGWREYMRAIYHRYGRRMRSANRLGHARPLADGWWDATTGLAPVDLIIRRVLDTGYAHHIERLMVLGNAMCLLRTHPQAAYEWFMELFVDAYDWVMVPNVYAMSQFAAGTAVTTKPYVSGSNYLRKMSDLPPGEWAQDWDALFWAFVHDHREVFEGNHRMRRMPAMWDGFGDVKQQALLARAEPWLG